MMTKTTRPSGRLVVVATPIGNLEDLSQRGLKALAEADAIAAEDTRRTARLLRHFGLKKPLIALHDHNEAELAATLVQRLADGETLALVSDAGTPLISDPGFRLVAAAIDAGLVITTVPGPSAVVAALSVAGLPVNAFCFEGFLPARAGERAARLERLRGETRTLVFFEAVHRLAASLEAMARCLGTGRRAAVCRELTKQYESVYRGTLGELVRQYGDGRIPGKGEFVLVVAGAEAEAASDGEPTDRLLRALLEELPLKSAVKIAARATGAGRNELYRRALALSA